MPRRSTVFAQCSMALAVTLVGSSLVLAAPPESGKQVRIKMSLEVTGSHQHTGPKVVPPGAMYLPVKLSVDNSYSEEYVVQAETILTGPQKINPMDPASQEEMDEYNAKVKERADRIYHSADNLRRPGAAGGARPAANPMAMMNPEMMQKIMACGNDQACKQRIAMEMMAQQPMPSGPGAQVQADIQAISDMCINEKHQKLGTKGYEQCMDAEGRKRSTVPASAADDEPEVPELPDRYLLYRNYNTDCKFKGHTKVNESYTLGSISDGEGGGQYREGSGTNQGEGDFDPTKGVQPCALAQTVFDPQTNTFWVEGMHRVDIPVNMQSAASGRTERSDGMDEWIQSIMMGAPASGTKTQKFGFQTAKFTWSITRE